MKQKARRKIGLKKKFDSSRTEVFAAINPSLGLDSTPISTTGWMGAAADCRTLSDIRKAYNDGSIYNALQPFTLVHFMSVYFCFHKLCFTDSMQKKSTPHTHC